MFSTATRRGRDTVCSPGSGRFAAGRFATGVRVAEEGSAERPARRASAGPGSGLHEDAVAVVTAWIPPDDTGRGNRQRFLDLLADRPGATRADNPGAHITASAVVVAAGLDQVLLCLHGRIGRWVQLGGHCEPVDASVADAALREAREESGIDGLALAPMPIDLDIHPVNCRHGRSLHYDIRFALLAPVDAVATVSAESERLGRFAPNALPEPLASATQRLVAPAISAARELVRQP
jgi:8-oxo-dGTP pyrophosphatase MutT (NUDIX family)